MNAKTLHEKIVMDRIVKRAEERVARRIQKDNTNGYYVTCVKEPNQEKIRRNGFEGEPAKGTKWLVKPKKRGLNSIEVADPKRKYELLYAEKVVAPEIPNKEVFFENGSIIVSGKTLQKCFVRGILDKQQLKMRKRSFTVSIDETEVSTEIYRARDLKGNLIAKASSLNDLFIEARSVDKQYLTYRNERGKIEMYDVAKH